MPDAKTVQGFKEWIRQLPYVTSGTESSPESKDISIAYKWIYSESKKEKVVVGKYCYKLGYGIIYE